MKRTPIELTEAEWSVMKAVWAKEPCTAPEIQASLYDATRWAYSTVRTIMDRLTAKRLLRSEKLPSMTVYRSAVTREQAQRGELLYALKHAFDGALTPMMLRLIETRDLSLRELDELEKIIREKRKRASN